MYGPLMATSCPMSPRDIMPPNFTVDDNVGTNWYHILTLGQ